MAENDALRNEISHSRRSGPTARAPKRPAAPQVGEHPFYIWDEARDEVRWMCSWDTEEADVDGFAERVREAVAA